MVISSSLATDINDNELIKQIIDMDREVFPNPWNEKQWEDSFSSSKLSIHLISCSGSLAGFCLFGISELDSLAHLYKIVIHPKYQNNGNASRLFEDSCAYLKNKKLNRVYLEVSVANTQAIAFYTKFSFETLNRIKKFYSNGDDAFAMQKTI
jgi:ribosomal-protein-alanine N-acetyltransferase